MNAIVESLRGAKLYSKVGTLHGEIPLLMEAAAEIERLRAFAQLCIDGFDNEHIDDETYRMQVHASAQNTLDMDGSVNTTANRDPSEIEDNQGTPK